VIARSSSFAFEELMMATRNPLVDGRGAVRFMRGSIGRG
jgi:hypothetical protein